MRTMRKSLGLVYVVLLTATWCLSSSPAGAQPPLDQLRKDLKEWFETGKDKDVQASKQLDLALVELEKGELTYDPVKGFRWVCELQEGLTENQVPPDKKTIIGEQISTLMRDKEMGFLRQILTLYPKYDPSTNEGREAFRVAQLNAVAMLGPVLPPPPPPPVPPSPIPGQPLKPELMPQASREASSCGCGPVVSESVCLSCRQHRCGRRFRVDSVGGCGPCGAAVICAECRPSTTAPSQPTPAQERTVSALSTILITSAEILRHTATDRDPAMFQYVSFSTAAPAASPQEAKIASEVYSIAFHAFWNRDYREALEQLNQALRINGQDARIWYYKGFAEAALGDREAAHRSLACAVRLHRRPKADTSAINAALQRIQGDLRRELQRAYVMAPEVSAESQPTPAAVPREKLARAR